MALGHAGREVVWLRNLLAEMGLERYLQEPTIIEGDNLQANILGLGLGLHLDVGFFWISLSVVTALFVWGRARSNGLMACCFEPPLEN